MEGRTVPMCASPEELGPEAFGGRHSHEQLMTLWNDERYSTLNSLNESGDKCIAVVPCVARPVGPEVDVNVTNPIQSRVQKEYQFCVAGKWLALHIWHADLGAWRTQ